MPRIDVYLAESRKISRERAQELIKGGCVYINGQIVAKPANPVDLLDTAGITVTDPKVSFVGRGGPKLEQALSEFKASGKF